MNKVKFCKRAGGNDLKTNPYYNYGIKDYKTSKANYQCVDYAFQRSQELAEVYLYNDGRWGHVECPLFNHRPGYGDAKEWYDLTAWPKSKTDYKLGDIVVYDNTYGAGHGHVRIIEDIKDGYIYCSGGNESGIGVARFNIKVNPDNPHILGFIHNPYLLDNEEEVDYKSKYNNLINELKGILDKYGKE